MFKSFGVPERLLAFTVMENLAVYASCNFWLIWNPLSAVLGKHWTTNICMGDQCQRLYAHIESVSMFL